MIELKTNDMVSSPQNYRDWLDVFEILQKRNINDKEFYLIKNGLCSDFGQSVEYFETQLIKTINVMIQRYINSFKKDISLYITFDEYNSLHRAFAIFAKKIRNCMFFLDLSFISESFKSELYDSIVSEVSIFWKMSVDALACQCIEGNCPIEDELFLIKRIKIFTEIQIENILSNEIISEQGLLKKNIFKLTVQKDKLYAAVPSVQSIKVDRTLEVSGLESLKSWLKEKKSIFFSSDDQLNLYDLVPPKGILLSGVPGCGKSFSAKMIAKEWELPLYRFDIGSVYDKWMGESERRMRDALSFVDNVSPCILWVDEIEKALAVSDSGGNDTSQRILGQFLFWLQESKSRVFLVATANDISRLPSELFRKGRFSEIFFVDLPSVDERKTAIIQFSSKCLHPVVVKAMFKIIKQFTNEAFNRNVNEYRSRFKRVYNIKIGDYETQANLANEAQEAEKIQKFYEEKAALLISQQKIWPSFIGFGIAVLAIVGTIALANPTFLVGAVGGVLGGVLKILLTNRNKKRIKKDSDMQASSAKNILSQIVVDFANYEKEYLEYDSYANEIIDELEKL